MKIAIAGYGVEGEANYRYWDTPDNELTIVDEAAALSCDLPVGAKLKLGEGSFSDLDGYDMVVRTASLAPSKINTNGKIWSATNEFFAKCPAPIIGVTGTKGKGTTSTLIASLMRAAGRTVHLVGNIGVPAIEVLPQISRDDIVVFELSSFQLWDLEYSPHVAVVLLIEPDHLDVHGDMDDYLMAKRNIRKYQTADDMCIYHPTNQASYDLANSSDVSVPIRYGVEQGNGVYVDGGYFKQGEQIICSIGELKLIGPHNLENACAAITVALSQGVEASDVKEGLDSCEGLPHRLEFVREVEGVKYYNDSFSSAPPATVAAVRSFDQPMVLIMGGVDRGTDFGYLRELLLESENIKQVVLIGETRHKLAVLFDGVATNVLDSTDMKDIVKVASSYASEGDVVVLSPGCASFDMFANFYERGDRFREVVNEL